MTLTTSIQQIPSPVRNAEPTQLFARWQRDHDQSARDELVRRFMPLARKLALRYQGASEPLDDLIQVSSLALVKAIDRFDYTRGVAFSSFAVPTMAGELKRYFRDLGWSAHVPRGAQERALKIEEAQRKLTTRNGRAPTVQELAVFMELSIDQVIDGLEASAAHHSKSLDAPYDDGDGDAGTLVDSLGEVDHKFEFVDVSASISEAVKHLSPRDRKVFALRVIEDRTQTEIADEVGVSQMQVSRILRRALAEVRETVQDRNETSRLSR